MTELIAGKYIPLRVLGDGLSGKVYLVKHQFLEVQYALKVLDDRLSSNQRFVERFIREAEVLKRFVHPGMTQLRDFGQTEDGRYYMAMDFCDGILLKKILEKEGSLNPVRVLNILEQVLDTLEVAHSHGIVHRDIKPENIMVENNGGFERVKLLDFGITKLKDLEPTTSTTLEGVTIGTPQYMSPEQASGESDIDHRVDIYAVGILAYEMLSGRPPLKGETVLQTLLMHLTQNPEKFALRCKLPEFLESLVLKALEKSREERYQSARAFKDGCVNAMELFIGEESLLVDRILSSKGIGSPVPEKKAVETKILCLDDSEMMLHMMKHVLENGGYTVFTANSSFAIHEYLNEQGVKILITDVLMPDLPGTKVCRMLKKSMPDLKVILFSNIPERELERSARESLADGWVHKSAKPEEWLRKIKEIVA